MTKITKYKVSATIDASGDAIGYTVPIRGKILAIGIDYPAATCTVDIDSDGEAAAQKILDLAAANTDVVRYPRKVVEDNTGAGVNYAATFPIYEPFVVYGRLKLTIASGTVSQVVSAHIIVEEN